MNRGVIAWIVTILVVLIGTIPIEIETYEVVKQKISYDKTVHSIEVYFENVTESKLISKAVPYNAKGYRTYGETDYELFKEINVTVPYYKYGHGQPKNPEVIEINNDTWLFTFQNDSCSPSFRLFNPNYVPINIVVNYTIIQENKKFWEGQRELDFNINLTVEARQYTKEIKSNITRQHAYDEDEIEQYFGRGFCYVNENSIEYTFQNSTFIYIKTEKDYEKIEAAGQKFYEFNYVGTKYVLEVENVTTTEQIPHTKLVNKTVIDYKTVERLIKKDEKLPIYFALFAISKSSNLKKEHLNITITE